MAGGERELADGDPSPRRKVQRLDVLHDPARECELGVDVGAGAGFRRAGQGGEPGWRVSASWLHGNRPARTDVGGRLTNDGQGRESQELNFPWSTAASSASSRSTNLRTPVAPPRTTLATVASAALASGTWIVCRRSRPS